MKYVVVKLETKEYAKSYDDVDPDKYLSKLVLDNCSGYPSKSWTNNLDNALIFYDEDNARAVVTLLRSNSPFIFKIIEFDKLCVEQ